MKRSVIRHPRLRSVNERNYPNQYFTNINGKFPNITANEYNEYMHSVLDDHNTKGAPSLKITVTQTFHIAGGQRVLPNPRAPFKSIDLNKMMTKSKFKIKVVANKDNNTSMGMLKQLHGILKLKTIGRSLTAKDINDNRFEIVTDNKQTKDALLHKIKLFYKAIPDLLY